MQDSLRVLLFGIGAAIALGACSNGGVTIDKANKDASPGMPEVGRDTAQDQTVIIVNFDAPSTNEVAPALSCGDGVLEGSEACDDGNTTAGDGCTASCKVETDWACLVPNSPCVSTIVCGDGHISGNEACDDHNTVDGDGCSADCKKVEDGWTCPAPGVRCQPKCGDGLLVGSEKCDDGNTIAGDGCSAACSVETGFACPTAGQPCHTTVCGDNTKEGAESCDDGNTVPGDGCSMDCRAEPVCTGNLDPNGCTSPCGDGLKLPEEECDDGNRSSGDGCSADCKLETGWSCTVVAETTTTVPIVFRDMIPSNATRTTDPLPHPNFEVPRDSGGVVKGIVKDLLGSDREPEYNDTVDTTRSMTTNATDFYTWYHASKPGQPLYSKVVVDTLPLVAQTNGTYVYDHSGVYNRTTGTWTTPAFFALDGRGWATPPDGPEIPWLETSTVDSAKHNFSFTSEVRYWFEYQGGESLSFIGDDDVWVFVNGKLAVDLGGVHGAQSGSITLDATAATTFSLTVGKIYEIVVFQAERKIVQSSYKLTIGQFNRTRTECTPRCGDGVINGTETCDNGADNSDTAYGGCTTKCVYGPYCGDGNVDSSFGEQCDDGVNLSSYGQTTGCAPGCRNAPYCGDNKVDSLHGEECDNGPDNGKSLCTIDCKAIVP